MSETKKTMVVSDKGIESLDSGSQEVLEGTAFNFDQQKPTLLHRFHEWIKLDAADAQSSQSKWSNAGEPSCS